LEVHLLEHYTGQAPSEDELLLQVKSYRQKIAMRNLRAERVGAGLYSSSLSVCYGPVVYKCSCVRRVRSLSSLLQLLRLLLHNPLPPPLQPALLPCVRQSYCPMLSDVPAILASSAPRPKTTNVTRLTAAPLMTTIPMLLSPSTIRYRLPSRRLHHRSQQLWLWATMMMVAAVVGAKTKMTVLNPRLLITIGSMVRVFPSPAVFFPVFFECQHA
jgi:hypothetical protein